MPDKAWKRSEREIAKRVDGERNPVGTGKADVTSELFAIEVKERKSLPMWLVHALQQSKSASRGKLNLVVLHELGKRHDNDYVLMQMSVFQSLMEKINET